MKAFTLGFLVSILLLLGHCGYEDALAEQEHYCDMVRSKAWGNYKPEIRCQP